ncbi:MAG TPA: family 1 glycosylhydrolase, partial [Rariglobus sp.]
RGEPVTATLPPGFPHTHFLWKRTDEALYWGTKFLYERYKLPIVITENGLTLPDWVALDGRVHDSQRIDFLHRYLLGLKRAIDEGVDVQGYFQWSIMDNFEWAEGYKHRFGLIHVDYETQKRTLKDSAFWYRDVIRSNGAILSPASVEKDADCPLLTTA